MPRYRFGDIVVTVKHYGEISPPWGGTSLYKYRVHFAVEGEGAEKSKKCEVVVWGSQEDRDQGRVDHRNVAVQTLQSLDKARRNVDLFVTTAMQNLRGLAALERGKMAAQIAKGAQALGPEMVGAVQALRTRGLMDPVTAIRFY